MSQRSSLRPTSWRAHVARPRIARPEAGDGILRRFLADRRGVAAIEFGMIMPLMAGLWLGTTELTLGYASDRRIAITANAMADLVARQRNISDSVVDGIFQGGVAMAYPDGQGESMKMVVSSVHVDEKGKTTIERSRGHNMDGYAKGTPLGKGKELIADGEPGCTIVASVELVRPVLFLSSIFGHSRTLSHTFAYRPRSGACPEWS